VSPDGAAFDDSALAETGTCSFDWDTPQQACSPTITLSMPEQYVGGKFALSIEGWNGGETAETTAFVTIE
jgi:hypothetical protein